MRPRVLGQTTERWMSQLDDTQLSSAELGYKSWTLFTIACRPCCLDSTQVVCSSISVDDAGPVSVTLAQRSLICLRPRVRSEILLCSIQGLSSYYCLLLPCHKIYLPIYTADTIRLARHQCAHAPTLFLLLLSSANPGCIVTVLPTLLISIIEGVSGGVQHNKSFWDPHCFETFVCVL